jgi:hypothetical protein
MATSFDQHVGVANKMLFVSLGVADLGLQHLSLGLGLEGKREHLRAVLGDCCQSLPQSPHLAFISLRVVPRGTVATQR